MRETQIHRTRNMTANSNLTYDLIGRIVEETKLTRKDIVRILTGVRKDTFDQFMDNPEDFIIKASNLINDQKAVAIIEHITYDLMDEKYSMDLFTEPTIKGKLGANAVKTKKHLYDYLVYDSTVEKNLAEEMDRSDEVALYVKLPSGFYISTPVGRYNPDWAIAFYEGLVKHIYFVAETKGALDTLTFDSHLTDSEKAKIHCAREHFKAISSKNIVYDVVSNYSELLQKVMR